MNYTQVIALLLIIPLVSIVSLDTHAEQIVITSEYATPFGIQAEAMIGSDVITISGNTDKLDHDVIILVRAPNGNVVSVDQITPNHDGSFNGDVIIGGNMWTQDGYYIVTAQQSNHSFYTATVPVDIRDGVVVPEFGGIAMLVFSIAIIGVVVVSAKSHSNVLAR